MQREAVLAVASFALSGVAVWLTGSTGSRIPAFSSDSRDRAWWRLAQPVFVGLLVLAFVAGWALQEPNPADERAGIILYVLAAAGAYVTIRALTRALRAVRDPSARVPIGTVGLLRPRIIVSEEYRQCVTPEVLAAGLAHETAHARRRDPLRIWVAQLVADLQWPIGDAAQRLSDWLVVLESRCDDEAVHRGAAPEDLAEAILAAARLQTISTIGRACVIGPGRAIAWRVRRLLSPDYERARAHPERSWLTTIVCSGMVIGALWLGFAFGDAVLGALPGIER